MAALVVALMIGPESGPLQPDELAPPAGIEPATPGLGSVSQARIAIGPHPKLLHRASFAERPRVRAVARTAPEIRGVGSASAAPQRGVPGRLSGSSMAACGPFMAICDRISRSYLRTTCSLCSAFWPHMNPKAPEQRS